MNALIELDERLDRVRRDADRIAICLETGDLTAPVDACPGWDLRKLGGHVGFIHRWATLAIEAAAVPDAGLIEEPSSEADADELGAWMRQGAEALTSILEATPPDEPTWHPFPFEQRAWVWSRRQMVETAIHRWDAEVAATGASDLDGRLAATAIAEYFELGLPRVLQRYEGELPSTSLHVHCTDDDLPDGSGEWIVWTENGEYRLAAEHRKGDAALRAPAADLLLVLMGRADRSALNIVGDPAAATAWLDLPDW
ncbi:maleylpyruvate isomerase family mycothiol-dependent enzyme [Ilumatobacter nonamiensis]|uniref:maleylpyruvate isomerase family mycothiol-dependent enzyme n=1 Tax=Ilumatobacter nonamiensis TaxID=467093 RepID=UPI00034B711A|nr:maleylpyruvate isomerase family mycothiol-dependent enzyme [Ilumatobacter nonamiensis]